MNFNIIVAVNSVTKGIGYNGTLSWRSYPADMKWFRTCTIGNGNNAVIMGRKTWESIPEKYRPLVGRKNIILTRNQNYDITGMANTIISDSLNNALKICKESKIAEVYVAGGEQIYENAVKHPLCHGVFITEINTNNDDQKYDVFFDLDRIVKKYSWLNYKITNTSQLDVNCTLYTYVRDNIDERQYTNTLKELVELNAFKSNRTGIPTSSVFGKLMKYNLRDGIVPVLTTKSVPVRMVIEELLFFIRGQTDNKILQEKNVHIWDGNTTRKFLDSRGLTDYPEGTLGPMYGFNWRHFGAKYTGPTADYTGQGVDQLAMVIDTIKSDPFSRRLIVSAFDPTTVNKCVLYPCHLQFQFIVEPDATGSPKYLSCMMYQRSADMFLGVPFNITSYAILTHMVAKICGLEAKEFVHTIADCHLYNNHFDQAKEQISRTPRGFPNISFSDRICELGKNLTIDDFTTEDIVINDYYPRERIAALMAV
jgi:dihydrofolate reductase/thymidylate synthase